MNLTYEICLADYEVILPEIAEIIKAKYLFHEKLIEYEEWWLLGKVGNLCVKFERYEGYYFSKFEASDLAFNVGKSLLWKVYLEQGGNPNTQAKP
jgi:hypothetical protein